MDIAQSQLWIKMSEIFQNKDNADVTLVCEGETILAHSAILELRWDGQILGCVMLWYVWNIWSFHCLPVINFFGIFRSEYFKTALNTAVGGEKSTIEVEECSFKVLSAITGFMYGKSLAGESLDWEEATTLLPLLGWLFPHGRPRRRCRYSFHRKSLEPWQRPGNSWVSS